MCVLSVMMKTVPQTGFIKDTALTDQFPCEMLSLCWPSAQCSPGTDQNDVSHNNSFQMLLTSSYLPLANSFSSVVGRTGQTWTLTFDRLTLNLNPNLTHQVRMEDKEVAGAKPELVTKVYRCQCSTVILIHHLWLNPGGGWRGHTQDRVRYSSNQPFTANFHDLDVVCVCVCVMLNQWFFPFFPVCSDKVLCSDVFPLWALCSEHL